MLACSLASKTGGQRRPEIFEFCCEWKTMRRCPNGPELMGRTETGAAFVSLKGSRGLVAQPSELT